MTARCPARPRGMELGRMRSATASATPHAPVQATIGVSTEESQGTVTVRVTGEVDVVTSETLDQTLRALSRRWTGRVVVDLSGVTFMDSSGLRAIVRARDRMDAAGRWLVVRGATGQPRRLLDI